MLDRGGLHRTLLVAGALALLAVAIRFVADGADGERTPGRAAGAPPAGIALAAEARHSLAAGPAVNDAAAGDTEASGTEPDEGGAREPGAPAPRRTLLADAAAASLSVPWRDGSLFVARDGDPALGTKTFYAWTEAAGERSTPVPLELPLPEEVDPHVSWDGDVVDGAATAEAAVLLGTLAAHIDGLSALAEHFPEEVAALESEGTFAVTLSEREDSLDTHVRLIGSDGRELLATTLAELGVSAPPLADTRRPALWRSSDGASWDPVDVRSAFGDYVLLEAVAEHDGQLVAVGTGTYGEPAAWTSGDGERWQPVGTGALAAILEQVLPTAGPDALAAKQEPASPSLP
jgi:hypothetical protein